MIEWNMLSHPLTLEDRLDKKVEAIAIGSTSFLLLPVRHLLLLAWHLLLLEGSIAICNSKEYRVFGAEEEISAQQIFDSFKQTYLDPQECWELSF